MCPCSWAWRPRFGCPSALRGGKEPKEGNRAVGQDLVSCPVRTGQEASSCPTMGIVRRRVCCRSKRAGIPKSGRWRMALGENLVEQNAGGDGDVVRTAPPQHGNPYQTAREPAP